jgi:hypothetical protein
MKWSGRWVLGGLMLAAVPLAARVAIDGFDHPQHRSLFVSCTTCHQGAVTAGAAVWPKPADCATCHDGTVQKRVDWTPRTGPPPSNLRFDHGTHATAVRKRAGADSTLDCAACHSARGATWMTVSRTVVQKCLACHGIAASHLDAPDSACATCHVPLWQARAVPEARLASWSAPTSHQAPDFSAGGHGKLAKGESCATCHARDYCATCHVNAPEEPTIQALQVDHRSLAIRAGTIAEPASHRRPDFLKRHGKDVGGKGAVSCTVCHTQESCSACHLAPPSGLQLLPIAGPGRAAGARIQRYRPASHGIDFSDAHKASASADPQTCAGCHTREQCIECHRPNATAQGGYHPRDFLSRHPVAAYSQEVSCGSCHNTSQFCQTCHQQSGIVATATLGSKANYHDAKNSFLLGHGQAARQSLESCVSCHAERDCLTCHAAPAVGGRGFNPHGPGFDANRLRSKNSQMCTACHGNVIPTAP